MSKRFSFKLNGLHRYRQFKTNEAKLALGEIAQLRFQKQEQIEQRQSYLHSLESTNTHRQVSELQMHVAHVESVRSELRQLQKELLNLMEIESQRRQHLSHSMKDEEVIDKLREKKHAEHQHTVLREEQSIMDEIAGRTDRNSD